MKNTFVKVLSMMMALMMVVGILTVVPATAAECNHTKGELVEEKSKAPTCNAWGYSTYICGLCGEEWETDAVAPSEANHKYSNVPEVPASCLTDYISAGKKCDYCDDVAEGCVPTPGTRVDHQFVGVITEATCQTNKTLIYTCKLCQKTAETIKDKGLYVGGAEWLAKYEANWKKVEYANTAINPDHEDLVWTMVVSPSCTAGKAEGYCTSCKTVVRETSIDPIHGERVELNPNNYACAEYPAGVIACKACGDILTPNAQKNQNFGQHNNTTPIFANVNETVDAENLPSKPNGGKFTIKELKDYGYNVGDKLCTPATCTTTGVQLVQCECGVIYNKTLPKLDHTYNEGYTYQIPTDCTKAYVKTRPCANAGCDYEDVVTLVPAAHTGHNMVVVPSNANVPEGEKSKDASCTEIGYTIKKCSNVDCMGNACGAALVKDTYVDPLGHNWSAPVFVPAAGITCTSAGNNYKKTCSRCNVSEMVAKPATVTGCTWGAEVTVVSTCHEREYKYIPCTVCGAWKDNPTKTHNYTTGSQLNPNKHVYATDAELKAFVEAYDNDNTITSNESLGILGFNGAKKSTCTVAGELNLKCKYCSMATADTTMTVVAPKADHDYIAGSGVNRNGNGAFVNVREEAVGVTCSQAGYAADGKYCEQCGDEGKAPTVTRFDDTKLADVNKHTGTVEEVHTYTATCQKGSYAIYNTSCCGQKTFNISGPVNHVFDKEYGYEAPTCTTNGHHAYLGCKWCGAYKSMFVAGSITTAVTCTCGKSAAEHVELALDDQYMLSALGHNFKTKVDADRETCDEAGTAEYYTCTRGCDYATFNNKNYNLGDEADAKAFELAIAIPAHYGRHMVTKVTTPASCTSDAIVGGDYCEVCQKDAWFTPNTKLDHDFETILVNCKLVGSNYVHLNCTQDAAVVLRCVNCNKYETSFIPKLNNNHTYPNAWTPVTPTATQTCYMNTTEYKECTACADKTIAKLEQVKVAATGHYTTKGIESADATKYFFDYSCNKINEFKDYSCFVCGQTYLSLLGANGENVVHDKVNLTKDPTCTEVGYRIVSCKNGCNFTGDFAKYNLATVNETKPALGVDGKHTIGAVVLERVEATTAADGYVKYVCAVCHETITDIIPAISALVVSANVSANKVAAGETFTVTYKLSGKAYEFATLNLQATIPANMTLTGIKSEVEGLVAVVAPNGGISLVMPNDDEGNAQKVKTTVEGTALFTLTYSVNKTATSANATVSVSDKATTNALATATTAAIAVTAVGNLNGDTLVSAEDAQAIFAKVGTNDVAADVNLDGIVNLSDVIALAKFAASAKTAADYLEMVGEFDKLEDEVFALLENGKLNDVNNDKVVNISDAYALIDRVEDALDAGYVNLRNMVTMKDVVAYLNVNVALVMPS